MRRYSSRWWGCVCIRLSNEWYAQQYEPCRAGRLYVFARERHRLAIVREGGK